MKLSRLLSLLNGSIFVFACLLLAHPVSAATRTWDGGGADGTCGGAAGDGNKWSCALNWSGDTIPGASDVATFDSTSTKVATIDQAFSIQTLNINTGYTGTITQSADLTLSISFVHDTANGTFTGSSGTLTFSGGTAATWNVDTDDTFNSVTLNKNDAVIVTLTSGDTASVAGALALTDGDLDDGTISLTGTMTNATTFDGGTGTIEVVGGSAAITLVSDGTTVLPGFTLNANRAVSSTADGMSFAGPLKILNGTFDGSTGTLELFDTTNASFTLSSPGAFTASGLDISLYGGWTHTDSSSFTHTGGVYWLADDGGTKTFDVNGTETFGNLYLEGSSTNLLIASGDSLIVTNYLEVWTDGTISGAIQARGTAEIYSSTGTSFALTMNGTGAQDLYIDGIGLMQGDLVVNKASGTLSAITDWILNTASQDFTIQEGQVSLLDGYYLAVLGAGSTFSIEDGGTLSLLSSDQVTLGAFTPSLSSDSTVEYYGNYGDPIDLNYFSDSYGNLILCSGNGYDDFVLSAALDVNGDLDFNACSLDTVSGQNYALSVAGDWLNSGGTFTSNLGTVTLDGTNQTISGSTTFYNLTKTGGGGSTLTFGAGDTQTVSNTLTLQGSSANSRMLLRSSTPATRAIINPQGTRSIRYLDVKDNDNNNAGTMVCDIGCKSSGNNENWAFPSGSVSGGNTIAIEYTNPQDGRILRAGEVVEITWGTSASAGEFVNMDISFDGGLTSQSLFQDILNDGSQTWTVPDVNSTEVIIEITSTNGITELASDDSTQFTIIGTSPENTGTEETPAATEPIFTHNFIRGTTLPTVYYIDADNIRHPVFNEAIYFTYEDSWDRVEVVGDEELANYPLGYSLLPKAGVVLVKIMSVNTVYALTADGTGTVLRSIADEAMAANLYGSHWADYVIDIEPTFWTKFTLGDPLPIDTSIDQSIMKKRVDLHS